MSQMALFKVLPELFFAKYNKKIVFIRLTGIGRMANFQGVI